MADNQNDIDGKVGLNISDFKTGAADLARQIKVIDSEFKASAAGMDDWGNNAEGLSNRMETLTKTTDLQRQKVEALKNAYSLIADKQGESSKAAQDMQIRINKETEALNKSQKELIEVTTKLDAFGNETEDASTKTGKFNGALGKMGDLAKNIGGATLKAAAVSMAAVGTAAVGAAAGAFKLASDAGAAADDLLTLAAQTGLTTDQLQEMQYAANFVDVDLETMTGSMAKLTKNMSGAKDGTGSVSDAFKTLGVSITDSNGELLNNKDVWAETIDALGTVANETERDALAMTIFGKSAQDLNPLIKAGADEFARLGEEAHAMGTVLSGDSLSAAGAFDDMVQQLTASAKGAALQLGVAATPAVSAVLESVTSILPTIVSAIQTGDWTSAQTAITDVLTNMITGITEAMPDMTALAVSVVNMLAQLLVEQGPTLITTGITALTTFITGISDTLPTLLEAAIAIMLALVNALITNLPTLIPVAIQAIVTLTQGLIDALPQIIATAPALITTLVTALIDNLPLLIDAAIQIIIALTKALIQNLPQLVGAALQIIVALAAGLIQAIPQLLTAIPSIFTSVKEGFKGFDWSGIGKNIIEGIKNGIKNAASALGTAAKNAAQNALDATKNFLGIHSPSTVFEDQVGAQIGAGMANGITASTKQVTNALAGVNNKLVNGLDVSGIGGSGSAGSVVVNVPLSLDGKQITRATSRIQYGTNGTRSRSLGVVLT